MQWRQLTSGSACEKCLACQTQLVPYACLQLADEAVCIGEPPSTVSYLDVPSILSAALSCLLPASKAGRLIMLLSIVALQLRPTITHRLHSDARQGRSFRAMETTGQRQCLREVPCLPVSTCSLCLPAAGRRGSLHRRAPQHGVLPGCAQHPVGSAQQGSRCHPPGERGSPCHA